MYPRRSRFSPQIRPGTARQQRAMIIWAYVFLASIGVMFAAFVLSGNFGVHELICVMIGSGAEVVLGICCFVALPTLVRAMRDALQGPGDSRPAIGTFIMIAAAALIGTTMVVMGGGAFAEGYEDARQGPQTRVVTSCENFQTFTEHGHRGSTYYRTVFTLHFDDGAASLRHHDAHARRVHETNKPLLRCLPGMCRPPFHDLSRRRLLPTQWDHEGHP